MISPETVQYVHVLDLLYFSCECMEGFEGPNCEIIGIGFYGSGWALYPTIAACSSANLTLELAPHKEDGLVFYVGPLVPNPSLDVQGKSYIISSVLIS
jgi:hypothetical protein